MQWRNNTVVSPEAKHHVEAKHHNFYLLQVSEVEILGHGSSPYITYIYKISGGNTGCGRDAALI